MKKLLAILFLSTIMTACSDEKKVDATITTTIDTASITTDAKKLAADADKIMDKMADSSKKIMNSMADSAKKMVDKMGDSAKKMMDRAGDKMKDKMNIKH